MNPVKARLIFDQLPPRWLRCPCYDECLVEAYQRGWDSWACCRCELYRRALDAGFPSVVIAEKVQIFEPKPLKVRAGSMKHQILSVLSLVRPMLQQDIHAALDAASGRRYRQRNVGPMLTRLRRAGAVRRIGSKKWIRSVRLKDVTI